MVCALKHFYQGDVKWRWKRPICSTYENNFDEMDTEAELDCCISVIEKLYFSLFALVGWLIEWTIVCAGGINLYYAHWSFCVDLSAVKQFSARGFSPEGTCWERSWRFSLKTYASEKKQCDWCLKAMWECFSLESWHWGFTIKIKWWQAIISLPH